MPAARFGQLVEKSYGVTRTLLVTYIKGALLLLIVGMIARAISSGAFAVLDPATGPVGTGVAIPVFIVGFLFFVIGAIAQMLQNMYGLVLAVDRTLTWKAGIKRSWKMLIRLLLGGMWAGLRSFAWVAGLSVPFFVLGQDTPALIGIGVLLLLAGIGLAIWYGPRLMFTNVIQLKDGTEVMKSADLSYERTHGYWGKIVGNNLLFCLSIILVSLALLAIGGIAAGILYLVYQAVGSIIAVVVAIPLGIVYAVAIFVYFFALALFSQIYMTELYDTIAKNPVK